MGARKDKIGVDILFDDGAHNVLRSTAQYPILLRSPWNQALTGTLAVNTYDEFLKLVEVIADSYSVKAEPEILSEPSVVVLVGPSGSGKSKIATKVLAKTDDFEKLISYTTKDLTALKENDWYSYVDKQTFFEMLENGKFFESTMYAGHGFASRKSDVDGLLKKNKNI